METTDTTDEDPITRIRRLRAEARAPVEQIMSDVLFAYLGTERDKRLTEQINNMLDSFLLAEDAAKTNSRRVGRLREGRALTVIGESGAGKSRMLDRHFLNRQEFAGYGDPDSDCVLVSVTTPSPCTLRLLGMSVLAALGYETARLLDENVAWDLVHRQIALRGVRFLHIDELQHVLQSRNAVEIKKVQDTLKRLMQNREWPVWLILSGLPTITTMLSGDRQVLRRTRHVLLEDLRLERDVAVVRKVIDFFGREKAGLAIAGLTGDEFVGRLLHAALNQFGIVIEFTQDAILQALQRGADSLGIDDFAAAYRARTGCLPDKNVFIVPATDWILIDPQRALERNGASDGPEQIQVKVRRERPPRDRRNK